MNDVYVTIIIVLSALVLGMLFLIFSMVSQMSSFRKQVHFIARNDTNKLVTFYGGTKAFKLLANDINQIIESCRIREKEVSKQDDELKETLVNMSHDIRTPLTSLKGYFELLNETDDPLEQERYRSIITERIDSLSEILEAMFFFTKVSGSGYETKLDSIDMSSLTMQTLFSYFDDFEAKGMTPEVDIEENVKVIGNEQSIKRIVQNFIKNCLVHAKSDICISLKSSEDNSKAVLKISNTVFEDAIPDPSKVFDRFYKADTSRHVNSSGVGLSVTKKLANSMKGNAYAKLEGDTFSVYLELSKV